MKLFTTLFFVLAFCTSASAQIKWKTFWHHNKNYTINLPDFFTDGGTTASGIHYYNTDFDPAISVLVEGQGAANTETLTDDYLKAAGEKGVSYKLFKPTWYVISGRNKDGSYFYHKAILSKGFLYLLRITYPVTQKGLFDLTLPRIVKSFHG